MFRRAILCLFVASLALIEARAEDRLPGPIPADLVRVIDGDTVVVRAHIWIGQSVEVAVRLAGIDAPERHRPACAAERLQADVAKRAVESWIQPGFVLKDVRLGKYAGRVVADVAMGEGGDLGHYLLAEGLAVEMGEVAPWCQVSGDLKFRSGGSALTAAR